MSSVSSTGSPGERSSEWLRAARSGDRCALEQLVEQQRSELLSIATGQLDSALRVKESPSDLVQKSLLEGLQSFENFECRSTSDFGNYMRAILRNNLQDARRRYVLAAKRSLEREQGLVDPESHPDSISQSPSQFLQRDDDAASLRDRLATLPRDQQQIISLRYWEEMTFDQIAEKLGQKPDTVRKAFYRALAALSRAVGASGAQSQ